MLRALTFAAVVAAALGARCRFALDFDCPTLSTNESARQQFLQLVMAAEGAGFHQPGVGYDAETAFSFDGHPLNYTDGTLWGQPHLFSAASKEATHVSMLALAVSGNELALQFTGGYNNTIDILARKIRAYNAFNASFPGYGCFLPWVTVGSGPIVPNDGWVNPYRVPGLDNGELVWAVFAAASALTRAAAVDAAASDLAAQYQAWFSCMAANAKPIFYMGDGNVAAVVVIADPFGPVNASNYNGTGGGLLNDPYEGETLTVLLDLFGSWPDPAERELLWVQKRGMLQAVNYTGAAGLLGTPITVQRGFWFSAHEQWKAAMLPYLEVDIVRRVLSNCERARTWDAAVHGLPGLMASINDVTDGSEDIPDYVSPCGVPGITFQPVLRRDLITPYGAWQTLLHDQAAGLCWYRNMLAGPRMQGPHGSTEAINVNGTEISPLTTWDSKITTLVTMAGGIGGMVGQALRAVPDAPQAATDVRVQQLWQRAASTAARATASTAAGDDAIHADTAVASTSYDRFVDVLGREYGRVFTSLAGEGVGFGLPSVSVPAEALSQWPTCQ